MRCTSIGSLQLRHHQGLLRTPSGSLQHHHHCQGLLRTSNDSLQHLSSFFPLLPLFPQRSCERSRIFPAACGDFLPLLVGKRATSNPTQLLPITGPDSCTQPLHSVRTRWRSHARHKPRQEPPSRLARATPPSMVNPPNKTRLTVARGLGPLAGVQTPNIQQEPPGSKIAMGQRATGGTQPIHSPGRVVERDSVTEMLTKPSERASKHFSS